MRRAASAMSAIRHRAWQGLALIVAALMLSSCGWRGISNVQIPGGPGTGAGSYTVYVQVPDTLRESISSGLLAPAIHSPLSQS